MNGARRSWSRLALGLAALLVVAAVGELLPVRLPLFASGAVPAEAKGIGRTPLDDVVYWADQKKACGLSRDQLAAMMLVPSYPETGAPGEQAPSPMTLGRYDTGAGLYSFGQTTTPYPRAFWHAGAGMWALDSAGAWPVTIAGAISTATSAEQVAGLMASRWCANPTHKYVWGPWYACATGTLCEDLYNTLFDGTNLRNLTVDTGVGRDGGMLTRSCNVPGIGTVTCSYVDPSKAQGYAGFAIPAFGPSPITAPFYVFSVGSEEYRYWLIADTGYPANISAHKPITANARTSLTWLANSPLCDTSAGRGDCGSGPRVATTPWGNKTALPFGNLDGATAGAGSLTAGGWAIDPDTNAPVDIQIVVDGATVQTVSANQPRPDVAAVVPGYGTGHGFTTRVSGLGGGSHQVCANAVNLPPYGTGTVGLGCTYVSISGNPFGSVDSVVPFGAGVRVAGWAIDPDTTAPIGVHVYVDGRFAAQGTAGASRQDVAAVFPGWGAAHGFTVDAPAAPGPHTVCTYAINVALGGNPLLDCRSIVVPNGNPFGALDSATRDANGVRVAGWAIDPDTTSPIAVHIYLNGQFAGATMAGLSRPDVGAAYPVAGPLHGYDVTLPAPSGSVTVCTYAINVSLGSGNPLIACRTV